MAWVPTTDFEEEIVESQPYHDFIYGKLSDPTAQTFYPRPKEHLDFVQQQKKAKSLQEKCLTSSQNHKLKLISEIQRIAGTKPLGEQPTIEDWDTNENLVRETIALMRHVGFNPSVEEALSEECTISTHPITDEVKINRNGRKHMPIFFADKFFELKPRASISPPPSTIMSPIYYGNNSTEIQEENGVERFDESIGSQRSSTTSNVSNSLSQASSSEIQSRKSMLDYCKTAEFNNYEYRKTPPRTTQSPRTAKTGRTTLSPRKTQQSGRAQFSGSKTQIDNTPQIESSTRKSPTKTPNAYNRGSSSSPLNNSSNSSNFSRGNSSVISTNTYKDRSSTTANSGFESAVDEVHDEDSFETAENSLHESRKQVWRKNNNTENNGNTWRNSDKVIKTQSWRNSNMQWENNFHIQSNWRSPSDYRRKEQKTHKNKTELCTPKELYEKKRQSTQM